MTEELTPDTTPELDNPFSIISGEAQEAPQSTQIEDVPKDPGVAEAQAGAESSTSEVQRDGAREKALDSLKSAKSAFDIAKIEYEAKAEMAKAAKSEMNKAQTDLNGAVSDLLGVDSNPLQLQMDFDATPVEEAESTELSTETLDALLLHFQNRDKAKKHVTVGTAAKAVFGSAKKSEKKSMQDYLDHLCETGQVVAAEDDKGKLIYYQHEWQ